MYSIFICQAWKNETNVLNTPVRTGLLVTSNQFITGLAVAIQFILFREPTFAKAEGLNRLAITNEH
jgi:hypothetical protein